MDLCNLAYFACHFFQGGIMRTITREELEQIYREGSNQKAAQKLQISIPTMLKLLKSAGIPMKGPLKPRKKVV